MIGKFYKTNLLIHLAFTETPKVPQSFEDLQNCNPRYDPVNCWYIGGSEHDYFMNSRKIALRDLGARMNTRISNITVLGICF